MTQSAVIDEPVNAPIEISEYMDLPAQTLVDDILANRPELSCKTSIDDYGKKRYSISETISIVENKDRLVAGYYLYYPDTNLYVFGRTVGDTMDAINVLENEMQQFGYVRYDKGCTDGSVEVYYTNGNNGQNRAVFFYYESWNENKISKIMLNDYSRE